MWCLYGALLIQSQLFYFIYFFFRIDKTLNMRRHERILKLSQLEIVIFNPKVCQLFVYQR